MAMGRLVKVVALSERLRDIDTPAGRERLRKHLETRPFPHFEAFEGRPGYLVKIDEDGTRTVGCFVGRNFVSRRVDDSC